MISWTKQTNLIFTLASTQDFLVIELSFRTDSAPEVASSYTQSTFKGHAKSRPEKQIKIFWKTSQLSLAQNHERNINLF